MELQKTKSMPELKPKVKALYDAVLELLNENADVNALTVADITKRAGIGKGTAYDYFSCKEEIIAGAIIYDARTQGEENWERLENIPGFEEKICYCFHWVAECVQEQRAFARFLFLSAHPGAAKDDIMKKLQSMLAESKQCGDMGPMMILGKLCDCGMRECYIRKGLPKQAAVYMLLGSLTSLVMYLGEKKQTGDFCPEEMGTYLCEGFLKAVR